MAIVDFVVKNGLVVTEEAQILGTTDATSSSDTAASLYTAGGAAIAKKAYIGTDLSVGGSATISTNLTVTGDLEVNGGDITTTSATFNLINANATTVNFAGAATAVNIGINAAAASTMTFGPAITNNTFEINSTAGGTVNLSSDVTTGIVNLYTGLTTGTMNIGSANAGKVSIAFTTDTTSNSTGALQVAGGVMVAKDLFVGGGDIITDQTTFNLLNTNATTGNLFGAATAVNIGAVTGTTTINNPTITQTGATPTLSSVIITGTAGQFSCTATTLRVGDSVTITGTFGGTGSITGYVSGNVYFIIATNGSTTFTLSATANGSAIVTTAGTPTGLTYTLTRNVLLNMNGSTPTILSNNISPASVFNTNTLTGNIFGAATAVNIGATTGTTTINNPTVVGSQTTVNLWNTTSTTVNFAGAGTAVNIGASSGTLTIGNATITGTNATTFNMNGANPSIVTSSTGTASVFNTNATTINFGGAATTMEVGSTGATAVINLNSTKDSTSNSTGGVVVDGGIGIAKNAYVGGSLVRTGNISSTSWTTSGISLNSAASTYTDTNSAASSTVATRTANSFLQPTFASTNAITVTNASTLYIDNAPAAGSNTGITNSYALWVNAGANYFGGNITGNGNLTVNGNTTLGDAAGDTLTINGTAVSIPNNLNFDSNTFFIDSTNNRVGVNTNGPSVSFHNVGAGILSNNTVIDPDTYSNTVIAGAIADGSGWGVTSAIGGNAGTGDSWAIGHNGNYLYYAIGNASANDTFSTYLQVGGAGRSVFLAPSTSTWNVGIGYTEAATLGAKLDITANTPATDTALRIKSNVAYLSPDGNQTITTRMLNSDVLSFSGGSGQLFSIADTMTGTIFAVNDISGMPSIEVYDTGQVRIAELTGNVLIGTATDSTSNKLQVVGNTYISGSLGVGTTTQGRKVTISRATESTAEQLELRVEGGISTGNYDGIVFTQGVAGATTLSSIRCNYNSTGQPDMSFNLRSESNVLFLKNGGNVGVNTNNPDRKFVVAGTGADGTEVTKVTSTANLNNGQFHWMTSALAPNEANAHMINIIGNALSARNSGYFGFRYQGAGSNSNYVTIGGYGVDNIITATMGANVNIGNGTSDFGYKLGVAGTIYTNNNVLCGTAGSDTGVAVYHGAATGDYGRIRFYQAGSNNQTIHAFPTGWQGGTLAGQSSGSINISGANGVTFGSWNDVAMWCTNTGNMAIKGGFYNGISGALGSNPSNAKNHFTQFNSGSAGAATGWIAAAFGDTNGSRVVIGQAQGYGYIGSHNANLTDWAPLQLQNDSASATVMIGFPWGTAPDNTYRLKVNGAFAATTKSFLIDHPTKQGKKLRHGSLEGPENGVYVRGSLKNSNVIELPEYWIGLVDADTITVSITPRGRRQEIYVGEIKDNQIEVIGENIDCFYVVYGERKDVDKLLVEIGGE